MTFERFLLRTSARWITVEPLEPAVPHDKVLYIDRRKSSERPYVVRDRVECAALAEPDAQRIIFGVVGIIDLLLDTYLIVIDARVKAGTIFEHDVYRAIKLTMIPVKGFKALKSMNISKEELSEEHSLLAMLKAAISLPGFYFSHSIDITRNTQKRLEVLAALPGFAAEPDFARAEMRFVWNRFVGKPLADAGITSWIVPLILGYVDVREGLVNGKHVRLALLSRRSVDRPGLRYTARGADIHGNVSNFVETEQIVMHGETFASFVQLRGSIPLLWQQEACIKYKPPVKLKAVDAGGKTGLSQAAFEKHFRSLFELYGPVTAISLVDTHGSEAILSAALLTASEFMNDPKLHFIPWDFHLKTKTLGYANVDNDLLPTIDGDLGSHGYLLVADGNVAAPSMRQKGIVRTNCVDSLDRTNVVQSVVAHRIMDDALKHLGVLNDSVDTCTATSFKDFEMAFKATWADHADALAVVYAGSGALKTDYTRTGRRTKPGMLKDGYRACLRYVYQNFWDGQRQDGIDLFLGVVRLEDAAKNGLKALKTITVESEALTLKDKVLPYVVGICAVIGLMGSFLVPRWWQKIGLFGGAFGAASIVLRIVTTNGHKYVVRPRMSGTN